MKYRKTNAFPGVILHDCVVDEITVVGENLSVSFPLPAYTYGWKRKTITTARVRP